ncbi:MAG: PIN domain-containing protein [Eubacterium sp.]
MDFENVNSAGISGISKLNLNQADDLYIFYSEKAKLMTIDLHKELEKINANVNFIKVNVGTANALDFQLATYLGHCIAKDSSKKYFIVSKDKGFDSVCDFWKSRSVIIKRIDSIKSIDRNKDEVTKVLEEITTEKEANKVYNIICNFKTKQGIHNNLVKSFPSADNKKASRIYNAIKPLIKDKKEK